VVGVVGIVPAAVLVLAATANHIVGCDLTDIALRLVLEVFGAQLPCALELAHRSVNTAKSKVLAEEVVPITSHTTTGAESLDTFLDAVHKGPVGGVDDSPLFLVFVWCQWRVTKELYEALALIHHQSSVTQPRRDLHLKLTLKPRSSVLAAFWLA